MHNMLGIYHSSSGSSGPFIRKSPDASSPAGQELVLRRCQRVYNRAQERLQRSICVDWSGVPHNLLRAARFEWKIQRASDDAEDVPLAVNLDSSTDPTKTVNQWYIYVAKTKKFHLCSELRIEKEVFAKEEAAH